MKSKFKLSLLVGLLITLMMLTTACLSSVGDDSGEDELVWETKSTSTFAVKYPSQWLFVDGDPSVFGDAVQEMKNQSDGLVGLDGIAFRESTVEEAAIFAVIDLEASTNLEGPAVLFNETAVKDMFNPNDDPNITIEKQSDITLDGQTAYKYLLINDNSDVNAKFGLVFTAKQKHAFILYYGAKQGDYDDKLDLFKEMEGSFVFNY